MKLYKVHIKTYYFGIRYYDLFVLADTENNMFNTVYKHLSKDEDAEISTYEEVELDDKTNRIL